jgi:hypothetical protein
MKFVGAACWITIFSVAGFALVKLAFGVVCWLNGHDLVEAMVGAVESVIFGIAIGIESFLWLRDWRSRKVVSL